MDAGLAAWIVDKFHRWSDCYGNIETRCTKDELLTNIMIYWTTETIGSSFLPYYDFTNGGALTWMVEAFKQWTGSTDVPAAFALFPKDVSQAYVRAICSAERSVSATKVSVPLVHPPVGVVGAPTTNRFS